MNDARTADFHHKVPPMRSRAITLLAVFALAMGTAVHAETCPSGMITMGGVPEQTLLGPDATGSLSSGSGFQSCGYFISGYGDSVRLSARWSWVFASLQAHGRYVFIGPPNGTPVRAQVRLFRKGSVNAYNGDSQCTGTTASLNFFIDGVHITGGAWTSTYDPQWGTCGNGGEMSSTHEIERPAGTWFQLSEIARVQGTSETAGGIASGSRKFVQIQPGAFAVRCDGDTMTRLLGVESQAASGLLIDSIWPNPARGGFRASLFVPAGSPVTTRLLDLEGRAVETRVWEAATSARRELAFSPGLPAGVYFLQVSQGLSTAVREVVVRP